MEEMKDSRLKSLSENLLNIAVGFPINYVSNVTILPYYAPQIANDPFWFSFEIGIWFTIISVARQYGSRRLFNHFGENENLYTLSIRLGRWTRSKAISRLSTT